MRKRWFRVIVVVALILLPVGILWLSEPGESKVVVRYLLQFSRGDAMDWKKLLAYITGSARRTAPIQLSRCRMSFLTRRGTLGRLRRILDGVGMVEWVLPLETGESCKITIRCDPGAS